MVPAVEHAITLIIGADTLVPAGTGKLIGLTVVLCKDLEKKRGKYRTIKQKANCGNSRNSKLLIITDAYHSCSHLSHPSSPGRHHTHSSCWYSGGPGKGSSQEGMWWWLNLKITNNAFFNRLKGTFTNGQKSQRDVKTDEDKLTAVLFIRAITTVILTITHPIFGDASIVITGKVGSWTGGWDTGGTVNFVWAISTVIMAVTAPAGVYALLVVAGESIWRAGRSW